MQKKEVYMTLVIASVWTVSLTPIILGAVKLMTLMAVPQDVQRIWAVLIRLVVCGNLASMAFWAAKRLDVERQIVLRFFSLQGVLIGLLSGGLFIFWESGVSGFRVSPIEISSPSILVHVFFIPLVESILWCGVAYTALKRQHSAMIAIVVSALFFSLSHFGNAPSLFDHEIVLNAFIPGLVLSGVYAATGSLSAPILAHVLINLHSVMR